jgi:LacI family transcriptional regulator
MAKNFKRKRQQNLPKGDGRRLRICLRLWDWSEWCRQVFRGVQGVAHSHPEWQLQVIASPPDSEEELGQIQWDGIMTHVPDNVSELRRLMRSRRSRIVSFTAAPATGLRGVPSVRANDMAVARAIGKHLLSGGYRRFAYVTQSRPYAFEDFRARAVLEFSKFVGRPCDFSPRADHPRTRSRTIMKWLARLEKPVGLFAFSIHEAVVVVKACAAAGIAIPDELAVVAWDDDSVQAESVSPSISAAVYPAERLGHAAATLLDRLLRGEFAPKEPVLVEPSGILHVRQSSDVSTIADRDVHLARQYILEHSGVPLAVTELVSAMEVSRSKLERDFQRVTGKTLNQAIVAAHLERSKQLLLETRWPLERVAKNAGFGTKQHFHRTFRHVEEMTPDQYRRRFGAV